MQYVLEEKEFNKKLEEEYIKGIKFGRLQCVEMLKSAIVFRYDEYKFYIPESTTREERELIKMILKINKLLKENKLIIDKG